MSEVLYKYTTLESLALILKSKKIRLNPLTKMDDLQEAESADAIKYAPYVFISSWMDQPLESIAMWKLYSNMESGVRIALRRNPFERYTATKEDLQKAFYGIEVQGESIDLILPPEQCFNEKYFLLNPSYCQTLEKVQYTDDPKLLFPKLFDIKEGRMELHSAKLGRYKNSYWEFQNEERYVLRFLPINSTEILSSRNAAQLVYDSFVRTKEFLPYYDLQISENAFSAMEVTLAPQFSVGNKVLLECLCEKYNPNMVILESDLKNRVRL